MCCHIFPSDLRTPGQLQILRPLNKLNPQSRSTCHQPNTDMSTSNSNLETRNIQQPLINICSYNVQTLNKSNFENLLEEIDPTNTITNTFKWDIIGLCETHLLGTYNEIIRNGHKFYNSGPPPGSTKEHGVGFIVKRTHVSSIIAYKGVSDRVAFIKLKGKYNNITIIQCYLPTTNPNQNQTKEEAEEEVDNVYELIQDIIDKTAKRDKLFICGDFNAKIGGLHNQYPDNIGPHNNIVRGSNERGIKLANFCKRNNFSIATSFFQHRRKYTLISPGDRVRNTVDYIIVRRNDLRILNDAHTVSHPDISDHRLLRCKARLTFSPQKNKSNRQRFDINKLKDPETQKAFSTGVENLLKSNNVDLDSAQHQFDLIQTALLQTSTTVLGKPPPQPKPEWLSNATIDSIKQKHETRKRFGHKSIEYKLRKANVKKMIRCGKESLIDRQHQELRNLPPNARYHQAIKRLKLARTKEVSGWGIRAADKTVLNDKSEIINRWAEFYQTLYFDDSTDILYLPENPDAIPPILLSKLTDAIKSLKPSNAPGPDDLVAEMFKHGGETLHQRLLNLLNTIIDKREKPKQLSIAEIITLFKSGDMLDCANFRPITLLSHVYKLLMQIIYNRIAPTLSAALPKSQAAYQAGRSTIEQIQSLQQIIEKCNEFNQNAVITFIDFTKAFDSVDQSMLWKTLSEQTNIDPAYINLIKLLYHQSKARVRTSLGNTEFIDILKGVKQGDLLSALLFCIVLMAIMQKVFDGLDFGVSIGGEMQNEKGYADDIGLIAQTIQQMNILLDRLYHTALQYGLKINIKKTKGMLIGTHPISTEVLHINGTPIAIVDLFEYLGRMLNNNGDDTHAVSCRIGKAWGAFDKKSTILKDKRISVRRKRYVYESYIMPVALFACETVVWTAQRLQMMEVFQNHVMRWITGHRLRDKIPITELYAKTGLQPISVNIKKTKLRWFGHMKRSNLPVKTTFEGMIEGKRCRGRPKRRWRDDISEWVGDTWSSINNLARDRNRWRRMLDAI